MQSVPPGNCCPPNLATSISILAPAGRAARVLDWGRGCQLSGLIYLSYKETQQQHDIKRKEEKPSRHSSSWQAWLAQLI